MDVIVGDTDVLKEKLKKTVEKVGRERRKKEGK